MPDVGSTFAATCTIFSSSKQRTTWAMASVSNISEELVTETFALRRAGHQAGDIDKFHTSGNNAFRLDDLS